MKRLIGSAVAVGGVAAVLVAVATLTGRGLAQPSQHRLATKPIVGFPSNPPAVICRSPSILAGPSTAPPGAVTVDSGDNSAFFADESYRHEAADGTTYWFAPGIHTLGNSEFGQIQPASDTTYVGAPGAVLDGQGVNHSAFAGTQSGVSIRHLTIQNFNSPRDQGVVNHDAGTGWTIEYDTIKDNHGGAVFVGSGGTLRYNCLSNNGQYGFQGFGTKLTLDHNEIAGNNTDDLETARDGTSTGCGCTGGGKFWSAQRVTITNNWVHDNRSVGLWADTDDADFLVTGNYIDDNYGAGFMYEISYNAVVRANTFARNSIKAGLHRQAAHENFPEGAIYLSESGGDGRVSWSTSGLSTLEITGNYFWDNWDGVVLWENADRFCGSPSNTSSGYCTMVDPRVSTATCSAGHFLDGSSTRGSTTYTSRQASFWYTDVGATIKSPHLAPGTTIARFDGDSTRVVLSEPATDSGSNLDFTIGGRSATNQIDSGPPYRSDCRWKTQNVKVHDNIFNFTKAALGCTSDLCGRQGVFSNSGSAPPWSPYRGSGVEDAITFSQGNVWSSNVYVGPWTFVVRDQGTRIGYGSWRDPPYSQDRGSTCDQC